MRSEHQLGNAFGVTKKAFLVEVTSGPWTTHPGGFVNPGAKANQLQNKQGSELGSRIPDEKVYFYLKSPPILSIETNLILHRSMTGVPG